MMDALKQLNQAMHYIEAHLAEEIDRSHVAEIAGCSEYHFRRLFSMLSGMTLSDYIRRRRMTLAALELRQSDVRIIEVALKYGYESPDAFTRAFQSVHGVTPREARKHQVAIKAMPPMTFQLTIRGGEEMEYRIVEKGAFHIVGLCKRVILQHEGVNPEISEMWARLTAADIAELKALSSEEPRGLLNASLNFTEGRAEGTTLDHVIGVATNAPHDAKWHDLPVPASTWAVFTARGQFPDTLQAIWARIYTEWFPLSGYELCEGPEILWNESPDTTKPDYHSEIWIPVRKKQGLDAEDA